MNSSPAIATTFRRDSTGKPIIVLDASSFAGSNCPRKVYYINLCGLRAKQETGAHIKEFGTAVHKFIRALHEGGDLSSAIRLAAEHYAEYSPESPSDVRSIQYLIQTCNAYASQFPFFGLVPLEQEKTFSLPLAVTERATYLLTGTVDMIARHPAYGEIILDHKTTSSWKRGDYLSSYRFSTQMMVYSFVLSKLWNKQLPAMINGIFLRKSAPPELELSELFMYSSDQLASIESGLFSVIETIDRDLSLSPNEFGQLPARDFRCCEGKWGMCQFAPLCATDIPDATVAGYLFTQKIYDPLKFQND